MDKKLKVRMVVNFLSTVVGVTIGLGVNLGWYIFCGFILGWGDSAPNWYFNIQNYLQNGIIIVSVAACIIFANPHFFPKEPR